MGRALTLLGTAALGLLCLRALLLPATSDYPNQRTAARAYLRGFTEGAEPGERLYDPLEFQRWVDREGHEGLFGTYLPQPPASLLPYLPFAGLSPWAGKAAFSLLSLALFLLTFVRLGRSQGATGIEMILALLALGGSLTANLASGQETLIVAAILNAALLALGRAGSRGEVAGGMALGAAIALKLFGLPWIALLAIRRRLASIAAAVIVATLLTIIAALGFGPLMLDRYVRHVLPSSLSGDFHNLYHPASQSIETVLRRLFLAHPDWNPEPPLPAPLFYGVLSRALPPLVLAFALLAAHRLWDDARVAALAILQAATLVAAPAVNRYHLAPLAPLLLVLLIAGRGTRWLSLALAAASLAAWAPQGPSLALQEPRVVGTVALFLMSLRLAGWGQASALRGAMIAIACLALGVALPVRRTEVPESWRRVTPYPFRPLIARCPARDGTSLAVEYIETEGATRFHWPGYGYDRSATLDTVYERLTPNGQSGLWHVDALGNEAWLVTLPDADCRGPRFKGRSLLFQVETGRRRSAVIMDVPGADAMSAPDDVYPTAIAKASISEPDVSPDGRFVAWARARGRRSEIVETDRVAGVERILVPPLAWSIDPRYAWDGARLFFASDAGRCSGCTVIYEVSR